MDDGLLKELIGLQREENQLLRRYLWRLRFSLLSLLLLTTAIAISLGFLVVKEQAKVVPPAPAPSTWDAAIRSPAQPTTKVSAEDAMSLAPVWQVGTQ